MTRLSGWSTTQKRDSETNSPADGRFNIPAILNPSAVGVAYEQVQSAHRSGSETSVQIQRDVAACINAAGRRADRGSTSSHTELKSPRAFRRHNGPATRHSDVRPILEGG